MVDVSTRQSSTLPTFTFTTESGSVYTVEVSKDAGMVYVTRGTDVSGACDYLGRLDRFRLPSVGGRLIVTNPDTGVRLTTTPVVSRERVA